MVAAVGGARWTSWRPKRSPSFMFLQNPEGKMYFEAPPCFAHPKAQGTASGVGGASVRRPWNLGEERANEHIHTHKWDRPFVGTLTEAIILDGSPSDSVKLVPQDHVHPSNMSAFCCCCPNVHAFRSVRTFFCFAEGDLMSRSQCVGR